MSFGGQQDRNAEETPRAGRNPEALFDRFSDPDLVKISVPRRGRSRRCRMTGLTASIPVERHDRIGSRCRPM
jgi:hypothetical protein